MYFGMVFIFVIRKKLLNVYHPIHINLLPVKEEKENIGEVCQDLWDLVSYRDLWDGY